LAVGVSVGDEIIQSWLSLSYHSVTGIASSEQHALQAPRRGQA
jgi:hypothetical protein